MYIIMNRRSTRRYGARTYPLPANHSPSPVADELSLKEPEYFRGGHWTGPLACHSDEL